ncbi:universal stress protein [Halosimplex sp. TS25]|uniref:universal stress protein n=1 Tax=Halosimplex rarum TaxID=3396619 RepID=UPI0039E9FF10
MSESFLQQAMVPVANRENAAALAAALAPRVDAVGGTVIVVHVIKKAGGELDKASVEQRELAAEGIFDIVSDGLDDTDASIETEILYGTNVAETIIDAAHDTSANAIVFAPRPGSRWKKLLSGDVTHELLGSTDIPVLVHRPSPHR